MKLYSGYKFCVPTYGRKEPRCLEMLEKDKDLVIHLFVRQEQLDEGFYKHLLDRKNVCLHSIGYGVKDLGETRQKILEYCIRTNTKYCAMFDDGIFNVVNEARPDYKITDVLNECVGIMQDSMYSDRYVGFCFPKRKYEYADGRTGEIPSDRVPGRRYFLTGPYQACVWNIDLLKKHDLKWLSLDICGFEDNAMLVDCIKKGLIFGGSRGIRIDGIVANEPKPGGSHDASEQLEQRYDKGNKKFMEYVGPMYGVYLTKRYRSFAKGPLSFVALEFDYFYEVLVLNYEDNEQIIKNQFKIGESV